MYARIRTLVLTFLLVTAYTAHAQYCPDSVFSGTTTFYPAAGYGNCSYPLPGPLLYAAAASPAVYNGAAVCGTCLQVTSAKGTATVILQDLCPSCTGHNLDMDTGAINALDSLGGIVPIQWQITGCPVTGAVQFVYQGSNPYYVKVQVRNHRFPVSKFEAVSGNTYTELARTPDNFFIAPAGLGQGPFTFRITDILGDTIIESNIPLITVNDSVVNGSQQFANCVQLPNSITTLTNIANDVQVLANTNSITVINTGALAANYMVYSINGSLVASGNLAPATNQNIPVPANGIYLVHGSNARGRMVQKVVVQ